MTTFKDHFSAHSADYAKYRPNYPPTLFAWLATLAPARDLAWDVGTGSGQAALEVARHFARVIASDAAEAQLRNATAHACITYKVMPAEHTDLADRSVDLVTVAQAIHWFDFARFYDEVRRVLKPGGVIAVWTYAGTQVTPEIDAIVRRYYTETVGSYWPPERALVDAKYRTIPFPFAELEAPRFHMEKHWDVEDLLGYLGTWSATKRYAQTRGVDPIEELREPLAQAWGTEGVRAVEWGLHIRVGRV
ncbi:MAG: SAM-dependent methyltransferase [Candidatus Muproteobacteria bacterium RBG_16_60_9]|uniref:SAM-dependent methyltransferase n=1 Tax=Candidatus Muproteobacteria bacterium RBG_16_60_9 TaxID=1817755 RepID=A0A1F6UVN5_9PROT|nr:MAG: SAM-dependent methyltransferase [Candidatus Muproteobacteria bacterium RBG_16_60_9]